MDNFNMLECVGQGCYSNVMKAYDISNKRHVAIKVVNCCNEECGLSALQEIKIYKYLQATTDSVQKNIATFFDSYSTVDHIYLVMELLSINLQELLIENQNGIENKHIKTIAKCTLSGLKYLHDNGIIHSDLKLNNIVLINRESYECKVIDLGLGLYVEDFPTGFRDYPPQQNIFYQAPEVFIRANYDTKVDIFSLGCVIAYLCNKRVLFSEIRSFPHMAEMVEYLGLPPKDLVEFSRKGSHFFNIHQKSIAFKTIPGLRRIVPKSKSINAAFKSRNDPNLTDVIKRCLSMDPNMRSSAEQLLHHPWFREPNVHRTMNTDLRSQIENNVHRSQSVCTLF